MLTALNRACTFLTSDHKEGKKMNTKSIRRRKKKKEKRKKRELLYTHSYTERIHTYLSKFHQRHIKIRIKMCDTRVTVPLHHLKIFIRCDRARIEISTHDRLHFAREYADTYRYQ